MINKELTDFISKKLNIARKDLIEKDIIISKILFYLMQDKNFYENYAFKGGSCLIKCYLDYYRFSEDIDFTYINQKEFIGKSKNIIRELLSKRIDKLGELIETIAKRLDLDFKIEKENQKYVQFGGSNAFVTFKIWYNSKELEKETFVKIQVNHIEKLKYPITELNAEHMVPKNLEKDFSFLAPEETEILLKPVKVKVYDMREILIEKVRAILTRKGIKTRDFIDIFLILNKTKLNLIQLQDKIIAKTKFMLKYEKYLQNLKTKEEEISKKFILGEEKKLLLKPIDEGFENFLEDFKSFLKKLIKILIE